MPWLQLIVECNADQADQLSDLLSANGAAAVTFEDSADQPLFEPPVGATPLWNRTRVVGLFAADADLEEVSRALRDALAPAPLPPLRIEALEDRDWSREWMDRFQPMRFGRRLWIVPSWHEAPREDDVNILLDPGLAFGTGTHPTTRLCLEWLDAHGAADLAVIDYGCGSGILAIAAAKLGARLVRAVDNDPQALLATADNATRNGVQGCITTLGPDALPPHPVDLLLANILAGPLIALAPRFATLVRPGGRVVLSGILADQTDAVLAAYRECFDMEPPAAREEWVRLEGRRK